MTFPKPHVVVLGSANRDLVYDVESIPRPGETVLSTGHQTVPGGKGNNQAVAAARSGALTAFIVALGDDEGGRWLANEMREAGILVTARNVEAPTGTAVISVSKDGENAIIVDAGSNAKLTQLRDEEKALIASSNILLMQLEVPVPTVLEAASTAKAAGTYVVLNAAPSHTLPEDLIDAVDLLIVNEHEAATVAETGTPAEPEKSARALSTRGPAVIVTLGGAGAIIAVNGQITARIPGRKVAVVDTTGAGDTFCGALVTQLRPWPVDPEALEAAAIYATAAASLSVQQHGAVPSIPTRALITAIAGHAQ
ncbi:MULTISPECIES: ribokinase [Microbacterium]|uniref:ribokinase n=1 Tax=Microbacterium TaxID=33882 RepID=UPI0027889F39|nr:MULTISPECIES: ribokinase [Microbacterium]MDQ1082665.1 ribokinase [Microbacterium sp. SORGH_AS_0344]MDQ1168563.1 ribokinase [Microbacterium proteolyticum]